MASKIIIFALLCTSITLVKTASTEDPVTTVTPDDSEDGYPYESPENSNYDERMEELEAAMQKKIEDLPIKIKDEVKTVLAEENKNLNDEIKNLKKNTAALMKLKNSDSVQNKLEKRVIDSEADIKNINQKLNAAIIQMNNVEKKIGNLQGQFMNLEKSLATLRRAIETMGIKKSAPLPKFEDETRKQTTGNNDGYITTPGMGSHKIYTEGKTYMEAEDICRNDGAHLAFVDSPTEAQLFGTMVHQAMPKITNVLPGKIYKEQAYIGIHYDVGERQWLNAFDAPIKRFNWAQSFYNKKQPSGGSRQECVTTIAGPDGEWNDVNCGINFAFICEKK